MTAALHDERLDELADIAVTVGVNIQPGQPLAITAPLVASSFVQQIARTAYRAGSGFVSCIYEDPALIRLALTEMDYSAIAPESAPPNDTAHHATDETARLHLVGPEPNLLYGVQLDNILALHGIMRADRERSGLKAKHRCVMPFVTQAWATAVRPGLPVENALEALWSDIFTMCGANANNGGAVISGRQERVARVCDRLNAQPIEKLHLIDEGTDLYLRPLTAARWSSSEKRTEAGVSYLTELPPGPARIALDPSATHGVLSVKQPLEIAGAKASDLTLGFDAGRVVHIDAGSGRQEFAQLIGSDAGAAHLSMIGIIEPPEEILRPEAGFLAPALDRASRLHVSFGAADETLGGERGHIGANRSAIRIDVPLGSDQIEVHGILHNSDRIVLFRDQKFIDRAN